MKKEGIDFYVATNEPKAVVVERLNRTLKSKLYCYFTSENTLHYIDDLQDIVDSYNNMHHRSIARSSIAYGGTSTFFPKIGFYGSVGPL